MSVPRNGFTKALKRLYDWCDSISVCSYSTLPSTLSLEVSANQQSIAYDTLTIDGVLTVDGEMRVVSWPT